MKKRYKILIRIISIITLLITVSINGGNAASAALFSNDKNNIIPKPLSYVGGKGEFVISRDTVIYVKGRTKEESSEIRKIAEYLRDRLSVPSGFQLKIVEDNNVSNNGIFLTTLNSDEMQGREGYKLISTPEKIEIIGYNPEGIFRGIQSLIALLPAEVKSKIVVENIKWSIPASIISDKPEYEHRGFMIDVARRFFTVDDIKR